MECASVKNIFKMRIDQWDIMAAISETPEEIFSGSTDPGESPTENNGIDNISPEDENKASKKRKHESDKNDTELADSNKQSKQFIEDDESDDGAFCPIVS